MISRTAFGFSKCDTAKALYCSQHVPEVGDEFEPTASTLNYLRNAEKPKDLP